MQDSGQYGNNRSALQRLQRAALQQCGWHWLGLLGIGGSLSLVVTTGAAFTWLVPAAAVQAFVHRQLWRYLRLNRSPDRDQLNPHLGMANTITLGRGWGISVLAGFIFLPLILPAGQNAPLAWTSSALYLLICSADAVDGIWARRTRTESLLGQKLDTEMDALGVMAASAVAVGLKHLPFFYLLTGLSYYWFQLGIRYRENRGRPVRSMANRPFRRVMSGMTMGFLVAALLPLFPSELLKLAAFYFMLPLLLGFLWDWLDVTGRLTESGSEKLRPLVTSLATAQPVVIRTGLLLCGLPVAHSLFVHWPAAAFLWVALWAMMVSGCLGRSAAIAASCLLGVAAERYGYGWIIVAAASCSILLILSGTGKWSVWKPEDNWIRQRPIASPRRKESKPGVT